MVKRSLRVGWFGFGGHSWQAEQYRDRLVANGHTLVTSHEYPNASVPYDRNTIKQFIDSCDVLIFPTREVQPAKSSNRLVLAWSRRKPCIVSSMDAFVRIGVNRENCLIVDPKYNDDDFVDLVNILAEDPALMQKIADNGYKKAMLGDNSYNPTNYSRKYLAAISNTLPHVHVIIPHYAPRVDYLNHAVMSAIDSKDVYVTVAISSSSPVRPVFNHNRVSIYHQHDNMTFSVANNKAIEKVPKSAQYVFLLNDDAFLSQHSLKRMVEVAKANNDNVILNPYSNCDRGWLHNDNLNIAGKQLVPAMDIKDFSDDEYRILRISQFSDNFSFIESPFAAFYATLIPRKILEAVGKLSEDFRNGGEDADYCFRAAALGYKIGWTRSAFVYHFGGKSRKVSHETRGEDHVIEDLYNNKHLAKKWPKNKKRICIYTGPAWEKWDIDTPYKTGIGGSEYCAGQLAKIFAAHGHSVTMYGDHIEAEEHGVSLKHWTRYRPDQEYYDLLVASRSLASVANARAKTIVAWSHDVWLMDGKLNQQLSDRVTKFICLSPWHVEFFSQHHGIPKDRIIIIPNGMDTSMLRFEPDQKVVGKLHYSSSPDRGLDNILGLLPYIKDHIPDLHLDVYYGFHNWSSSVKSRNNPDEMRKLDSLLSDLEKCKSFVNFKDRVNLPQLHEAWNKAYTWLFPTLFTETFCCDANTFINTAKGTKLITEIVVGDSVQTHQGTYKPVTNTFKNKAQGKLLSISTKYLPQNLVVTKNHPVLRLTKKDARCGRLYTSKCSRAKEICGGYNYSVKGKNYSTDKVCERLHKDFPLAWVGSESLQKGDFLAIPKNQKQNKPGHFHELLSNLAEYYKDGMSKEIANFQIDYDLMKLFGWYVAEGSYDGRSIICFSLNANEDEESKFIESQLKRLGLNVRIDIIDNSRKIVAHSAVIGRMLEDNFGKGARNKRIPQWIKDLSFDYIIPFIQGLYEGDGNISRSVIRIEVGSKDLVWDINECLIKSNIISSISYSDKPKIKRNGKSIIKAEGYEEYYTIATSFGQYPLYEIFNIENSKGKTDLCIYDSKYVYYKVNEISEVESTNGYVYNLEVDDHNSYLAQGIVVHNCITAKEAQYSGTPIICSDIAALKTTVGQYGMQIPFPYSGQGRQAAIDEVVKLHKNKDYWIKRSLQSLSGAKDCDWESVYQNHWSKFL